MRARALSPVLLTALLALPAHDAAAAARRPATPLPTVAKVAPAPAQLTVGERLAYAITAQNRSRRVTKRATVRLLLSADAKAGKDDVQLGRVVLKALPKGRRADARIRATVPAGVRPGVYRLLTCSGASCRAAKGTVRVVARAGKPVPGAPGAVAAGVTAQSEQAAPPAPPASRPGAGTPGPAPGNGGGDDPGPGPVPDPGPPLDPPRPDPGVATSMAETTKFLYEGKDAPQQGVAPGAITPERVAVTRGKVFDPSGTPVGGAEVSVLGHPEYGRTWTRSDGGFDLALNGATVDLIFRKAGFPDVQRQVSAPWRDYDVVDDVVMTPYDTKVSTVDLDASAPFQAVVGSAPAGQSAPVLLFPQGVKASLDLAGNRRADTAEELKVRATEFPRTGDATLPGTMPGNVGLTYAAEFSVDEAISKGASSVDFDKPVINYTENRNGAPVGSPVPTAYYDREQGRWIAQPNGRVIAIVSEADGIATVDVDGDGAADSGAKLDALKLTDAERRELARLYEPGRQLWRVPITHFTPWDHNWPWGPPPDAKPPKLKEFEWKDPNDPCNKAGSIISCETQVLGEQVPVAGTPYKLTWSSQRAPGYKVGDQLTLPVTGGQLPPQLKGVQLEVEIAGKRIEKRWCDPNYPTTGTTTCEGLDPIKPNLTYDLAWDGRDAYGNPVQGKPVATVTVTYVYEFKYYPSSDDFDRSFGQFPEGTETFNGAPYCGNQLAGMTDNEAIRRSHFFCGILARQTAKRTVGAWDATPVDGLGGLSLDVHHGYDPNERVVHRGDGTVLRSETLGMQTRTLIGGSGEISATPSDPRRTNTDYLADIAIRPDGSICGYSGLNASWIWCQGADGKVRAIGGKKNPGAFGEGTDEPQPALGAVLGREITSIAAGPDGSIYFLAYTGPDWVGKIRRIAPDGTLTTVAGCNWKATPNPCAPGTSNGDGGPARQAKIWYRGALDVGPDGSLYFSETGSSFGSGRAVVRRVAPDGTVSTIAGGALDASPDQDLGDGELATQHQLGRVDGIEVADDGTVYLADYSHHVVEKVGADGRITRVAGNPQTAGLDLGKRGAAAGIGYPKALTLAPDGSLYVLVGDPDNTGSERKILKIDETGLVTRYAGRTTQPMCRYCLSQDGEPALGTLIESNSAGIETKGDGTVVYGDGRYQVRQIEPALPGYADGANVIPETDGSTVHLFDERGRHRRTVDGLTGATLLEFAYDADNRLTEVRDATGQVTRIERDGSGRPQAIVAPNGERTEIELDDQGRAHVVKAPGSRQWTFDYGAGSLLSAFTAPGGRVSHFEYDADGRLTKDVGPDGSFQTLSREESLERTVVTHTSGAGKKTTYVVEVEEDGDRVRRVTEPSGAVTKVEVKPDGTSVTTRPDGTTVTTETGPDPRWGTRVAVPEKQTTRTPGGKEQEVVTRRTVELADPLNPLSVKQQRTTIEREGDPATSEDDAREEVVYDGVRHTLTRTTGERRTAVSKLDALGRVVEFDGDGGGDELTPLITTYDEKGRVKALTQGNQQQVFAYDAKGRLGSRTDAAGEGVTFGYDDADRLVSETYPGGRVWRYEYDAAGTQTALVTPEGRRHAFTATARGRTRTYDPPGADGPYTRHYDADGRLEDVVFPSGATRDVVFDDHGRETSTDHGGQGTDALTYAGDGETIATMTRTAGAVSQAIAQTSDGIVPTQAKTTGAAEGTFDYAIGAHDLRLQQTTLKSGADAVTTAYAYDADGLATKLGPFTLTRSGPSGAVSTLADDTLSATYDYDGALRLANRTVSLGGEVAYENAVTRDNQGRVASRTVTAGGTTRTFTYDYDAVGELTSVKEGSTVREAHTYDKDGNRTSGGAAYDDEGALTSLGGKAIKSDADGFVTERGDDRFTWSRSGDLVKAVVGGTTITYAYDAMGRRVARTEDGSTEQYLYGNPANPFQLTASRSADGVLSTFTYDTEDALVSFVRNGTRYYVGSDQVGTPEVVLKGDGSVVKRVERDAFGVVTSDSAPAFRLAVGFAGGIDDPVTGLVRFGARDYDPASGRFLARDPSLFVGSPKNLFAYAGSDPVSLTDPTGLTCFGAGLFTGAGIALQYCRQDGKQSFCAEAGVGVGGGLDFDPWGAPSDSGPTSVVGELTGKWGPIGGTVGFESDLDCFNTKGTVKLQTAFLGIGFGGDTTGATSTAFSGDDWNSVAGKGIRTEEGTIGGKIEGKLTLKRCIGY